ncbi:hypothetical protein EUGRSUZ_A02361 [Eucalyptus grandis]|uniref:Uncharacterized protein n=2 Tax=Eucalyptus grandis TaxID=71139 RepID=A0A059DIU2_EUCGR|nr:hypothetical protein EUGRSUZ_A02361 [Eucalyptus grandis]
MYVFLFFVRTINSMVLKRRARVITYGGGVNPKHLRVSRCSSSYGVDLEGRLDAIERRLDQIEDELQATRQENAALRRRMDEFEATYQEMIRFVQHSRRTQDGSSSLPPEGAPQVNNHRV